MNPFIWAAIFFLIGYVVNMFFVTVLYHRALTHNAISLSPFAQWLVAKAGVWVTGIDPKTWICMHRLHHLHSDTALDPHSPVHYGVFGVAFAQLKSYEKIAARLSRGDRKLLSVVEDIHFDVSQTNRKGLWYLPYVLHLAIAVGLGLLFQNAWVGVGVFAGFTSHPVQGYLVNSFAHYYGYRNHDIPDQSRNNVWVSLVAFGEGYQNNHHAHPSSAKFSHRPSEVDFGYGLARVAQSAGLLRIRKDSAI